MYSKLRLEDPSVGDVFDAQLDWASQERIFTIMIGNLVSRLDDASATGLVDTLVRLGRRHHELGVSPKQYGSMQRAILAALEELLGEEWTNEYQEAWAGVFNFISHTMVKAAQEPELSRPGQGSAAAAAEEKPSGGGDACPVFNKYITSLKQDTNNGSTDGHRLQRLHPGGPGTIEE